MCINYYVYSCALGSFVKISESEFNSILDSYSLHSVESLSENEHFVIDTFSYYNGYSLVCQSIRIFEK